MSDTSLAMMPWFPRDFIAATRAMRIAERCAYRELLDFQWELGVLPNDESRLARLIGFTDAEFSEAWPGIRHKFVEHNGGLVNKRLEEHRVKALEQRAKKRRAAESTNAKRDAKRIGERAQNVASLRDASATPPSPSPSPTIRKTASQSMGDDEFAKSFAEFKSLYPRRSGDQRWPTAEKHIRARLREGCTWDQILDGVRRYAQWVRAAGKEGTETVKQAATFVGTDKGFTEDFELPRHANGTSRNGSQPRLSAVERVRAATEKWLSDGEAPSGGGVVVDA